MTLTLLHTSPAHVPTFAALRDRLAPGTPLRQEVREAWLDRARAEGVTPAIEAELAAFVAGCDGTVICTCTTLGPAAEAAGAIRVDRPMMQAAGRIGGRIVMVYTLESTVCASLALLKGYLRTGSRIRPLDLTELWPLFEAGEIPRFHAAIAEAVQTDVKRNGGDCIVLAQASMAGAGPLLRKGKGKVPVLASPEMAMRLGLGLPV